MEAQIAACRRRLQAGGLDCSLKGQIAAWRLRLQPGNSICIDLNGFLRFRGQGVGQPVAGCGGEVPIPGPGDLGSLWQPVAGCGGEVLIPGPGGLAACGSFGNLGNVRPLPRYSQVGMDGHPSAQARALVTLRNSGRSKEIPKMGCMWGLRV